jgi:hypothetical protein
MEVVLFFVLAYGIANIMIFSSIFRKWREFWKKHSPNFFGELFSCMICLPFWIGFLLSIFVFSPSTSYLGLENNTFNWFLGVKVNFNGFAWFLDACLTSGGVWLIHTLQEKLEK